LLSCFLLYTYKARSSYSRKAAPIFKITTIVAI
jgi:hypothetical protein